MASTGQIDGNCPSAQMKPKQITLDRLDWRILEALQSNARISNTELGKQIGLSQPAVTARIKRLEEQGVIEGYAARINPGLVGRGIGAIVRIKTTHAQIKHCLSAFEAMPEIIESHRITGEDCFMVRIVVEDMAQLEAAIDTLAKFGPVTTAVVLASYPPKTIRGSLL
jgi:Lrp/AsnC family leucine-responsive transcriptional regulator